MSSGGTKNPSEDLINIEQNELNKKHAKTDQIILSLIFLITFLEVSIVFFALFFY